MTGRKGGVDRRRRPDIRGRSRRTGRGHNHSGDSRTRGSDISSALFQVAETPHGRETAPRVPAPTPRTSPQHSGNSRISGECAGCRAQEKLCMTHLPEVCYAYNVPESGVAKKAREDNGEFHPSARPAQKLAGQPKPRSVSISRYCVKSKELATPGMCIYNNLMRITFDPTTREKTPAERRLDFADATFVFAGVTVEFEDTRKHYGETRVICYGLLDLSTPVQPTDTTQYGRAAGIGPSVAIATAAVQQPALVLSTPPPAPKIPDSDAPHRSRRHRVRFTPRERPSRATLSTRVPTSLAPSSTPTPRSGDLLVSRPRDARRRAR